MEGEANEVITNVPDHLIGAVAALCASDEALTAEQAALLAAEIANDPEGRGYAGKPVVEVLTLLASPYEALNPEPQGVVARAEWATDELANVLLQMPAPDGVGSMFTYLERAATGEGQLAVIAREFLASVRSLKALNLANPLVQAGLAAFLQAGVLTTEQHETLTTVPDPAWSPYVRKPSRLEALGFGAGAVATARDL